MEDRKEVFRTVTDVIDYVKNSMCDGYCKYVAVLDENEEMLDKMCVSCPLNLL